VRWLGPQPERPCFLPHLVLIPTQEARGLGECPADVQLIREVSNIVSDQGSPGVRVHGISSHASPPRAEKPPAGSNWIHEIKHDGFRLMARRDPAGIRLLTRNAHEWSDRYPAVVAALNHLPIRSRLIDGGNIGIHTVITAISRSQSAAERASPARVNRPRSMATKRSHRVNACGTFCSTSRMARPACFNSLRMA